ncbi:hypothetical protein Slin15195_G027260 [Septoria linicola]|uniref:Uncharacterized protein n=1 Tax=Septoria linicola TaxID=215465 RepID=A0A9Q9ANV2_9PEZI|nr:hypothetical protein Slin15195_G027260 [Septoria linicola]
MSHADHLDPSALSTTETSPHPDICITASSPPPDESQPIQYQIEYLARTTFVLVRNEDAPPWLEDHISEHFKAEFDNISQPQTWQQQKDLFRKFHQDPNYSANLLSVSVNVREHGTHADAYMLIETVGRPGPDIRRQNMAVQKWWRRDGKWHHIHTMRGGSGLDDSLNMGQ